MRMRNLFACLLAVGLILMTVSAFAATVNFVVNPGFETGADGLAPPWSAWGGTWSAIANPVPDATNSSPRVWSCFNNPTYVNVAAQNDMNLILDTTGTVVYHVKAMYYVPVSEVLPGITPRAAIRLSCDNPVGADGSTSTYVGGAPFLLDDAVPEASVTPGQWHVFEFDWTNTSGCGHLGYMAFRLYGHNAENVRANNPGIYVDNCEFSSSQYRNDITGVVKDSFGANLAGVKVFLKNAFSVVDTATTSATGAYAFTKLVPYGTYTVSATLANYDGEAPKSFTVDATSAAAPLLTMTKWTYLCNLTGKVKLADGTGVAGVEVSAAMQVSDLFTANASNTTTGVDGSYATEVVVFQQYYVAVRKPGYSLVTDPALMEFYVEADKTFDIEVVAVQGFVEGKVTTTDGKAPAGFVVAAKDATGKVLASYTTTDTGAYNILVDKGACSVSAIKPGYVSMPAPQSVTVVAGQTSAISDFVAAPAVISGVLKDKATGKPIYNGVVQTGGISPDITTAIVTDATGAFTLPGTGCGGVEIYGDAIDYHCANLLVTGDNDGEVYKDVFLTAEVEPLGLNGNMEDLVGDQPAQWPLCPWGTAGSVDWYGCPTAKTGAQSLFLTTTATQKEYDGVVKIVQLTPGYLYNFYYSAKADPEVFRWQPMVEFMNALPDTDPGYIWNGFVSNEPAPHREYSHDPYYDWHVDFNWMDRAGKWAGVPVRVAPIAGATEVHFIFIYEGDDRNNVNGNTTRMPIPGKGVYVDDLVLDAVAVNEPLITVPADPNPSVPVANITALKGEAVGTAVKLTGAATVTYAPTNASEARSTTFFYIGEKQGLGGLRVVDKAGDTLKLGDTVTNLTGKVQKTAAGEFYLELTADPTGVAGTEIAALGLNNKSVASDASAQTNAVRVWGKVQEVTATYFTISDGYSSAVKVMLNGVALPAGFDNTKTAVVTGVVSKDDSSNTVVLLQKVSAF